MLCAYVYYGIENPTSTWSLKNIANATLQPVMPLHFFGTAALGSGTIATPLKVFLPFLCKDSDYL